MIVIRECKGFEELQACVDLQIEVWGYSDGDVIPRRAFLVAQKIGGQVIGAFDTGDREQGTGNSRGDDAGSMVGFALSLPGVKTGAQTTDGRPVAYLHSHMLAVREGFRNQNIGARLKLAQREDALARGLMRMEWTFDPLEIKNAFLNIYKLGAVVQNYQENFYGASSSRLQGGLQTDRLVAEWWIDEPRVTSAMAGGGPGEQVVVREIRVPGEIYAWKADDERRHLAREVQAENRLMFQHAFAEGLAVVGFRRNTAGDGIYEIGPWAEHV